MLVGFVVFLSLSVLASAQPDLGDVDIGGVLTDPGSLSIFNGMIGALTKQWGNLTKEDFKGIFDRLQNNGLDHIWNEMGGHCSSNIECGPDACCVEPHLTGKRAITDGSKIHFASYCAPLRTLGQTCSKHDNTHHTYKFQCPCAGDIACVPERFVQLHPLIRVPINPICKSV